MHRSSDPTPYLIEAIRALGDALNALTLPVAPSNPSASVHQDSGERVDELDLLLELLKRALGR